VRHFFSRAVPPLTRVLLVESGSRQLFDTLIPKLYQIYGDAIEIDLVTCFAGVPEGFRGKVSHVTGPENRLILLNELKSSDYAAIGIICAAEPIMTKWKWWLAAHLKSKIFILNENGDYFWLDWERRRTMLQFAAYRAGLTGSAAVPALVRFFLFPLTLAYLILYACTVNLQRGIRLRRRIRLL
jgi:hypothetical protein